MAADGEGALSTCDEVGSCVGAPPQRTDLPEPRSSGATHRRATMPQRTTSRKPATKAATAERASTRLAKAIPADSTPRTRNAGEPTTNGTGQPRLGKGGLETLVLGHMKNHPKVEFTST